MNVGTKYGWFFAKPGCTEGSWGVVDRKSPTEVGYLYRTIPGDATSGDLMSWGALLPLPPDVKSAIADISAIRKTGPSRTTMISPWSMASR
jgi:hypothetical protein